MHHLATILAALLMVACGGTDDEPESRDKVPAAPARESAQ